MEDKSKATCGMDRSNIHKIACPVSILICTRDRRELLENLLADIEKQSYPKDMIEVIVVEEIESPSFYPNLRYFHLPVKNRGISYARNYAFNLSKNDIIVYVDDDCRVGSKWLYQLLSPFHNPDVIGVQGGVSVIPSTNAIGWCEIILGFPGGGIKRLMGSEGKEVASAEISTLNCAYRKWVIEKIGLFDESLKFGGEDYLLAKQVCDYGVCLFIPKAMVYHKAREEIYKIWAWFVRRGRAEIQVSRTGKYKKMNNMTILRSSLFVKFFIILLSGFLFIDFFSFSAVIFALILVFINIQYLRYYKIWNYSNAPRRSFLLLPFVKALMDLGADWGRFKELFFYKKF